MELQQSFYFYEVTANTLKLAGQEERGDVDLLMMLSSYACPGQPNSGIVRKLGFIDKPVPDTIIILFMALDTYVRRDEQYPLPPPPSPPSSHFYLCPNPSHGDQPDPVDRISGLE